MSHEGLERRARAGAARDGVIDPPRLAAELRAAVAGEVRFDDGSRALYATDASNYRQVPIGVVIPRSTEDVVRTVAICRRNGAPLLSRGARCTCASTISPIPGRCPWIPTTPA